MPNPEFLDQAFTRAAGAALVPGNRVRLLRDARENYPAWLEAIASAERTVLFESYMFCEDEIGLEFQQALAARARQGVRVRVIYDWLGSFHRASARYWRTLRAAGAEVRCFNRPRIAAPFSALHRDHRKMLAVDGRVGFVTGLGVGRMWTGDPQRGIAPWRDTGIELLGPALRDIENAFAQVWAATGAPLADGEPGVPRAADPPAGTVAVRIVASTPGLSAVLRTDQLVATAARRSLWLTDAYFAGIPFYIQALRSAARDGVDVRLLVPGASDVPIIRPLSQVGYRPLLEAGVRVFEWKGSMLHAKTAVADGRWARVGSSNLNVASWLGNFELDVILEDEGFAAEMERMYVADLAQAREIVLRRRRLRFPRVRPHVRGRTRLARMRRAVGLGGSAEEAQRASPRGSASRAAAGALRIGRTVGAALSEERVLAPTEARLVAAFGVLALLGASAVVRWPLLAAVPAAVVLAWVSLALFAKALALRRERRRRGLPPTRLARAPSPPSYDIRPLEQSPESPADRQSGELPPRARNS